MERVLHTPEVRAVPIALLARPRRDRKINEIPHLSQVHLDKPVLIVCLGKNYVVASFRVLQHFLDISPPRKVFPQVEERVLFFFHKIFMDHHTEGGEEPLHLEHEVIRVPRIQIHEKHDDVPNNGIHTLYEAHGDIVR